MQVIAMLAQADTRTVEALERLASVQVVMAVATSVLVVMGFGAMIIVLLEYRSAKRLIRTADAMVTELRPRVAPLVDRAKQVTNDVAGMTDNMRRKVDDVLHTIEDLRRAVERGGEATEERVRRFAAVLDVVQSEAEELLLDATATARGMHETARSLNQPRRALRRPRPDREESEE
jgi:methyl-accepting chemotaxis protein